MCSVGSWLLISHTFDTGSPVVLGNPWMRVYSALLDYAQNTVSFAISSNPTYNYYDFLFFN